MQKKLIVIIGGPGTGKSTIIDKLSEIGYCCYPEISRQITIDAQQQGVEQLFLSDPLLFSSKLLEGRVGQFDQASGSADKSVFFDRGIPDVLAYMNFKGDDYPASFEQSCAENLYTQAFLLEPWKEIYKADNERYESFEQAQEIHQHLVATYKRFGYELITVPQDNLEKRIRFILDRIWSCHKKIAKA